jgi:hypothetical protein
VFEVRRGLDPLISYHAKDNTHGATETTDT